MRSHGDGMTDERPNASSGSEGRSGSRSYESPRVERVLASEDLEREMLYAGPGATIDA